MGVMEYIRFLHDTDTPVKICREPISQVIWFHQITAGEKGLMADFDWCIRIMKKADVLHNTHLTLIDYLNEGMTTRNHKASLKERFRIMSRHYGWASTVTHHLWFVLRLLYK